jgi:hypothetical protein
MILKIGCAVALSACSVGAGGSAGVPDGGGAFNGIVPARPPSGWGRVTTPSGDATLAYPPSFRSVRSDPGSISLAAGAAPHVYEGYLNVTPRQGPEQLHGFAAFRLDRLGDEDAAVHEIAAAEKVAFAGAVGSCVNDDYRTRVGDNHYEELACLVAGRRSEYVIVASALFTDWDRFAPTFRSALGAFEVS